MIISQLKINKINRDFDLINQRTNRIRLLSNRQERLLLSLLPRFLAIEIISDIAHEADNKKLLSAQFHKFYIHSYNDVR
jgi:hypothetical protein